MVKFYTAFVVMISFCLTVFGQQTPVLQQNLFNNYSLQPAYSGYNKGIDAWNGFRKSMFGFATNPTSALLNVSYRTNETSGFGLNLQSDQFGLFRNNNFGLSYAYRLKVSQTARLAFGVTAGIAENRFDFTGVKVEDRNDFGVLPNNGKTMFKADLGVAYINEKFEAGAAILNVLNSKVAYKDVNTTLNYQIHPSYIINAAYLFVLKNPSFSIKPVAIVRGQQGQKAILDLAARLMYKKVAEFGIGYRSNGSLPIFAIANLYKGIHAYYGYEVALGDFAKTTSGGHEFGIGYRVTLHKSIDSYVSHEKELSAKNDSLNRVVKILKDTITIKNSAIKEEVKKKEELKLQTIEQKEVIDSLRNVIRGFAVQLVAPKIDENKVEVETARGYYVVVESSKDREALIKDIFKWASVLPSAMILKDYYRNWYYIASNRYETKREALQKMNELRKQYPKTWVKIQKIN